MVYYAGKPGCPSSQISSMMQLAQPSVASPVPFKRLLCGRWARRSKLLCSKNGGAGPRDGLRDLIEELSRQPNVRVLPPTPRDGRTAAGPAPEASEGPGSSYQEAADADEDQDVWDDVLEELEDPWMMYPVTSEAAEELLAAQGSASAQLPHGSSASPAAADATAASGQLHSASSSSVAGRFGSTAEDVGSTGSGGTGGAGTAGSSAKGGTGGTGGAYAEVESLRIDWEQLQTLMARQQQHVGGGEGAGAAGDGRLVLLDVRSPAEFADSHIPGSISVPLEALTREAVAALIGGTASSGGGGGGGSSSSSDEAVVVVVVGSGSGGGGGEGAPADTRSLQACVRLTKVFRLKQVLHFEGGVAEYQRWREEASHEDLLGSRLWGL